MKPRSIGSLILAALFLISALALAVTSPEQSQTSFTERLRRVRVAEVSSVTAARSVRFAGVTRAAQRADRAARALLWPAVSSLEALRRQRHISLL